MNDEPTSQPSRVPWWARGLTVGLIVAAVLVFSLSVLIVTQRTEKKGGRAAIDKRLAAIREAGQPVTAEDLAKLFPDPPLEHDAYLLLAPAIAAISIPDSVDDLPLLVNGRFPTRVEPFDEAMKGDIETLLKNNQAALDAVPWGKLTNAWIGSGFSGGFANMAHPRLHPLLQLTKLLCLSAIYNAELGHNADATQQLHRSLMVGQTFRSDTLLHHLCRRVVEARSCDALERILNRTKLSTDYLLALEQSLVANDPDGLRKVCLNTRCLDIWQMEMFRRPPAKDWATRQFSDSKLVAEIKAQIVGTMMLLSGRIYKDSDYTDFLDRSAQQIAALNLPPRQRVDELQRVKVAAAKVRRRPTLASVTVMGNTGETYLYRACHDAEILAKMQVARIALTIECWRLAHEDRVPETLSELVPNCLPAIPTDPFDNQPLRYKKLGRGYAVYSIGSNFTDDGGKERPEGARENDHYDITFIVER